MVRARDAAGNTDLNLVELSATPEASVLSGKFVDAQFGSDLTGDGSLAYPWRHITYALTQVTAPETIYVFPGTYDATVDAEGFSEIFPIVMLDGVSLVSLGGRDVTTIDAGGVNRVLSGTGLGPGTRLEGFTLSSGSTRDQTNDTQFGSNAAASRLKEFEKTAYQTLKRR